jgi:hypothetical protein
MKLGALGVFFSILLATQAATADVKLPGGQTIPKDRVQCWNSKPGGLGAIFACTCTKPGVCNIGAHCSTGQCPKPSGNTCEATLWHEPNGDPCIPANLSGLDPIKDASLTPETFTLAGGCGLTFTLKAREALFKNAFGWYNVRADGKKPDTSDLHPLIDCNTNVGDSVKLDITGKYKGGDIGFFIVTPQARNGSDQCHNNDCCATLDRWKKGEGYIYYSQPQFNPDQGFIHLLVYKSKILNNTFYFSWEDLYESNGLDFSDFVTQVSGIRGACQGAGVACNTDQKGICKTGVTACGAAPNTVVCESIHRPEDEICDGLDNNCNGEIDDGATCKDNKVCYRGRCVPKCQGGEFSCTLRGTTCDPTTGLCVDKKCISVQCTNAGEVCIEGQCIDGCKDVKCPHRQVCKAGICVDPCAGRSCAGDEVCLNGVCVPRCDQCNGLTCENGTKCNRSTGSCDCPTPCGPGTHCEQGKCVDDCHNVTCPLGYRCAGSDCVEGCVQGRCPPGFKCENEACIPDNPPPPGDGPISTDGPISADDGGVSKTDGGDKKGDGDGFKVVEGCGCSLEKTNPLASFSWVLVFALALLWRRGRKRRR